MIRTLVLALLAAGPALAQGSAPSTWQPRGTAELRVIDKIRAQPSTLTVKVGASVQVGSLLIQLRSCAARPPDLPADSAAFVDVRNSRAAGKGFQGWILANTPAISQFEDPLYDLRLVACR